MATSPQKHYFFRRRVVQEQPGQAATPAPVAQLVKLTEHPPIQQDAPSSLPITPSTSERPHFTPHVVQLPLVTYNTPQTAPMALPVQRPTEPSNVAWPRIQAEPKTPSQWPSKLLQGLFLLFLLGGGGWLYKFWNDSAAHSFGPFAAAATPTPAPTIGVQLNTADNETVIAKAVVKPLRSANLEMTSSGPVTQIFVKEGGFVKAGQPILRLDSTLQSIEVAQAKVALLQAQNRLAQTQAASRPEEIAAAQAVVDEAQARLTSAGDNGVRPADLVAAQAQLAAAQAQLQEALNGPQAATLTEAQANLKNAEAVLRQATSAYEQVKWRNDIAMLPEALDLQKATNDYEAAKARYNQLAQPATPATISNLRSQVEAARANLARIQTPAKQAELDAIAAQVRKAQADLQLLQAGARPEVIAGAQAEVKAAEVALLRAQAVVSQTVLLAPFAGLIGDIGVEVGDQVAPGKVLVQLGDVSSWRIETSDLTELDITKVQEGAQATSTIDALPGETFTGRVSHIKRLGENKVGDIVYTVEILPTQADSRFRWNMTAAVTIQPTLNDALSGQTKGN